MYSDFQVGGGGFAEWSNVIKSQKFMVKVNTIALGTQF